ncbi:polyamine aminopropyltransferase [Balneola sp. MJW-20]|uniref:polyamine aminopropyltransferase n=1 Tax=Gracilimonas aurantiaca TaxID=3234185 RepID=UPI0034665C72
MGLQYNEYYNGTTGLTVGVNKVLFSEETPYQKVEVYETDTWGNLMVIDGMVMLSEKDEFVYHEMLVHPTMFSHPNPEKVLIIGGGDGGTAREVLKHASVKKVDMVEIDEAVIRAAKEFLPEVGAWDDPRLSVKVEDGIAFIKNAQAAYDVVIIDGSDPVGPAEGLFSREFIQLCRDALTEQGVFSAQTESPWIPEYHKSIANEYRYLSESFTNASLYLGFIPLYPSGMWSFAIASHHTNFQDEEVMTRVGQGMKAFGSGLKYYNAEVHKGAFALPNFVADIIS